ncbi:MAG TPA: DinB family protein [Chryseolinea sp.]|nr:DinB family protein [Chryseolinea sp.]
MQPLTWFERTFTFGFPTSMLPFLLERLDGTIIRVQQKIDGIPEEHLGFRMDDKWSIKENIGHLLEVDVISGKRIGEIAAGQAMLSRADVQTAGHYNEMSIRAIVAEFTTGRQTNIRRLLALSEKELAMTSLHPRLKVPMSPVDLAWFDAEHDDHHLVRINQIVKPHR